MSTQKIEITIAPVFDMEPAARALIDTAAILLGRQFDVKPGDTVTGRINAKEWFVDAVYLDRTGEPMAVISTMGGLGGTSSTVPISDVVVV